MCKTPSRICVVYGSESGTAERGIRAICKKWRSTAGCNFEVGAIMEGQAAAKIGLEALGVVLEALGTQDSLEGVHACLLPHVQRTDRVPSQAPAWGAASNRRRLVRSA